MRILVDVGISKTTCTEINLLQPIIITTAFYSHASRVITKESSHGLCAPVPPRSDPDPTTRRKKSKLSLEIVCSRPQERASRKKACYRAKIPTYAPCPGHNDCQIRDCSRNTSTYLWWWSEVSDRLGAEKMSPAFWTSARMHPFRRIILDMHAGFDSLNLQLLPGLLPRQV